MDLKDKVIIVTGAGHGLGAAIAQKCLESSARVVLADRDFESVRKLSRELGQDRTMPVACDVSNLSDLRNLVSKTVGKWEKIDGLVNNAGINFVKPFLETTEDEWDSVLDVDLKGAFFLTQFCAQQMISQTPQGGAIVQIASVHTQATIAGAGPYTTSKHGVVGFSKAAAVELAPKNIRINIVSPGLCRTDMWQAILDAAPDKQQCLDYWNSNIPGARTIEPSEIGNAVVFLLSEKSSAIIGANIVADLGLTSLLIGREPYQSKEIKG
jgi:NAD(P)-dependent dehydrogenase (short-subunit alcohol dehydrogenase family)